MDDSEQLTVGARVRLRRERAGLSRAVLGEMCSRGEDWVKRIENDKRGTTHYQLVRIARETSAAVVFVTHSISEAVFLADRVVTLSLRPSRIHKIRRVDFTHPRDPDLPTDAAFQTIVREIKHELAELGR